MSTNGPFSGLVGSSITFIGSVIGAQAPQFQWSFGDGSGGSGQSTLHTYLSPGAYTVTLTVIDAATGQSATTSTIASIIAPTPPPGPPPPPPPPPLPLGRSFASMAYHAPSNRVVLFGGLVCTGSRCTDQHDTWTWDGTTWTQQNPASSPTSRYGAAMKYHAASGRLVLFGGVDCSGDTCTDLPDTWTWDGSNWTQMSPSTSPPERSDAAMAYDAVRQVLVLFGGQDTGGDILSDTWIWNGSDWSQQSPDVSPQSRYNAGMTFDVARGVTVLFGGTNNSPTNFADTWTWDGTTWSEQNPTASPTPRAGHGMAYDVARNVTVLFGGASDGNNPLGDTWIWNGTTWNQATPGSNPPPRYGPGMAFDTATGTTVLFSGTNADPDTWTWDGTNWSRR